MALIALAGQGWLRGVGDLRTPLVIVVAANVVNVVLEVLFVYGFDWGLDGSACGHGHRAARDGRGVRRRAPARAGALAPPDLARIRSLVSIGAQLVRPHRRAAGLLRARHRGAARASARRPLAAHQIAFQLFGFLALVLDAIAIAGQVIVGRALGAGDADGGLRRGAADDRAGRSPRGCVIGGVLLALTDVIPRAFTADPAVIEQAHDAVAAVLR